MSKKFVYLFSEGNGHMRELLGGKGANLAEMTNLGMPVPRGFTITTEACTQYYEDGRTINAEIQDEIMRYMAQLEDMTGKKFGDMNNPLLVSVRSGARASMPGMMDTILNLGLNDQVVEAFAKKTKNPRFAYDSYRRFIQMYSDVVMEVGKKYFEELIDEMKAKRNVKLDTELTAKDLKELAEMFKAEYREKIGEEFPQDAREQLMGAVRALDCYRDVPVTFRAVGTVFTRFNPSVLWDGSMLALGASGADWLAAGAGAALMLAVSRVQRRGSVREQLAERPLALRWAVFGALLLAVVVFGAYGIGFDANQFIYNQF